jgi:hypothetical protein
MNNLKKTQNTQSCGCINLGLVVKSMKFINNFNHKKNKN